MSFRSAVLTNSKQFNMTDLEEKIRKAKKEKKIFIIFGGFEPLRQSLLSRGWIEKIPEQQLLLIPPTSENFFLAWLLKDEPFHFIWQNRNRPVKNVHQNVVPLQASIIRDPLFEFTSKDGLNKCVEQYRWHHVDGLTDINYQRSYILLDKTSREEFVEDFKRTAFTSFLVFLNKDRKFSTLFTTDDNGISTECVEFAIKKIELDIKMENHEDLDTSHLFDVCAKIPKNQKEILSNIRQIMTGHKKFKFENDFMMEVCKAQVQSCVEKLMTRWPHLKYDGHLNVWIIKPIGQSMGNGVVAMNSEEKILRESQSLPSKTFIVQKYVGKKNNFAVNQPTS